MFAYWQRTVNIHDINTIADRMFLADKETDPDEHEYLEKTCFEHCSSACRVQNEINERRSSIIIRLRSKRSV